MKNRLFKEAVFVCILVIAVQSIFSQGTIYTSRAAFEAALNSSMTITFESLPVTSSLGTGEFNVTTSGATFTTPDARLFITGPGGLYPIPGDGKYLWHFDGGAPVTILLPNGLTAFGADFSGGFDPESSYNATFTVNLVGGGSYTHNFSGPRGLWTFFGVIYSSEILNVIFDDGGPSVPFALHQEMLDNVTFGSAIPEPSVFALLLLGAINFGWRIQNRRKSRT